MSSGIFCEEYGSTNGVVPFDFRRVLIGREWRGFPGSGNAFDHFGFLMMRVYLFSFRKLE